MHRYLPSLLFVLTLIFLVLVEIAGAHPEMPHTFYGYVANAPDGAMVTAVVNNISASSTISDGWYTNLDVPADDPDTPAIEGGTNGDIIYFFINGESMGTFVFNVGGFNRLDFNFTPPSSKNKTLIIQSQSDVKDNRLREASPDAVLGNNYYIDVGHLLNIGRYRDVIWFNLNMLNKTDKINTAVLSLFWYYPAKPRNYSTTVEIYRPQDWNASYVNWNNGTYNTPWNMPGGDWFDKNNVLYGNVPFASITFNATTLPDNRYYDFDVTELVQDYVSGKYNNTGFFLKVKDEYDNYIAFYSSDWSNVSQRPKLTIYYTTTPTPTPTPTPDTIPPASIANLHNTTYEQTYINYSWNDPKDSDFSHVMIYINGIFKTNVSKGVQYYTATGLTPDTEYTISTHTADTSGNINLTWVNHTARTAPAFSSRVEVAVTPSNITVFRGQTFNLNITVDPKGRAISGAQLDIIFNSSLIMINSIEEGNLFKQNGASTYFSNGSVNNLEGIVENVIGSILGSTNVTSKGVFITINFSAIAPGSSEIILGKVKISDPKGNLTSLNVINGDVKIYQSYDINNDGIIDISDAVIVGQHYGETTAPPYPIYDVNTDGIVNTTDVDLVVQHID